MERIGGVTFRKDAIIRRGRRVANRSLHYIGGDLRRAMRRKLKIQTKKNPHSKPGEPPRIDGTKSPLKSLIAYSIHQATGKVLVGPMIFRGAKNRNRHPLPNILEEGGMSTVRETMYLNAVSQRVSSYFKSLHSWKRACKSPRFVDWVRRHSQVVTRLVKIKPRPFVRATLDEYIKSGGVAKAMQRAAKTR